MASPIALAFFAARDMLIIVTAIVLLIWLVRHWD